MGWTATTSTGCSTSPELSLGKRVDRALLALEHVTTRGSHALSPTCQIRCLNVLTTTNFTFNVIDPVPTPVHFLVMPGVLILAIKTKNTRSHIPPSCTAHPRSGQLIGFLSYSAWSARHHALLNVSLHIHQSLSSDTRLSGLTSQYIRYLHLSL
jgi:hypothetical protein